MRSTLMFSSANTIWPKFVEGFFHSATSSSAVLVSTNSNSTCEEEEVVVVVALLSSAAWNVMLCSWSTSSNMDGPVRRTLGTARGVTYTDVVVVVMLSSSSLMHFMSSRNA